MPITQNSSAPSREQRWLEFRNVGDTTVPSYGCVEIVDVYQPEENGLYTPGGGRTVYLVRRPTVDSPCLQALNGHCPIPPGEEKRIGTVDSPALGLVPVAYANQTVVGARKGSYHLWPNQCGWIIGGHFDAADSTQHVLRFDLCPQNTSMWVQAQECILPGDMYKLAQPMKRNATTNCLEVDAESPLVYVCDCARMLLALPGDCFKVEVNTAICNQTGSGPQACYSPAYPFGLPRRVKIT